MPRPPVLLAALLLLLLPPAFVRPAAADGGYTAFVERSPRLVFFEDAADSAAKVEELRRRIRSDRRDVEARRRLASMLAGSRQIRDRREAAEALQEALLVDDEDMDLWLRLARLRERQRFDRESRRAYQRAVELAPDDPAVWDELAALQLYRFQRFLDVGMLREAEAANRRALRRGPTPRTYRRSVRLAYLSGDPAPVDSLLGDWSRAAPSDPWPHLIRATRHHEEKRWDRAQRSFESGFALMDSVLRREFDVLRTVSPDDEELSSLAPDSARYVSDFWRWRDPTPADPLNPRLLEHWTRMVKAEIYFAQERRGVPGWLHAPGEMMVRYGIPGDWTYRGSILRFDFRLNPGIPYNVPAIAVSYGPTGSESVFRFMDFAMNGNYVRGLWSGDIMVAATPSLYEPPFPGTSADQDVEIYRFYDRHGRGRTEVAIALPVDDWGEAVLEDPERLLSRIAVYDETWTELDRGLRDWGLFTRDVQGRLVGLWRFDGTADSLIVGIETEDLDGSARSALYAPMPPRVRGDSAGVAVSDVAFLRDVRFPADPDDPYARYGGHALPNPGHAYAAGEPLGLGFEAYHLGLDEAGSHHARVTLAVSRRTRRGLFRVVLGEGDSRSNELVFPSRAPGATLEQILRVEVPELPEGDYVLELEVADVLGGTRAVARGSFSVVDEFDATE